MGVKRGYILDFRTSITSPNLQLTSLSCVQKMPHFIYLSQTHILAPHELFKNPNSGNGPDVFMVEWLKTMALGAVATGSMNA